MNLDKLEALADAATIVRIDTQHTVTSMNPAAIKAMIALIRMQNEAVRFMAEKWCEKHGTRWPMNDAALAAFDNFNKEA